MAVAFILSRAGFIQGCNPLVAPHDTSVLFLFGWFVIHRKKGLPLSSCRQLILASNNIEDNAARSISIG